MRKVTVRTSDEESFAVTFDEDGEPLVVQQTRTVWSSNRGAPSRFMSERVRRVVDLARKTDEEER